MDLPKYWDEDWCRANGVDPSITGADLSVRSMRCLLQWNPKITLEEAGKMTKAALMRIPGLGEKSVREIKEAYAIHVAPELFPRTTTETLTEQYARRTTEAAEKSRDHLSIMEATLMEILVELRKQPQRSDEYLVS